MLIGGRTLHSTFWIPLEVTSETESRIKAHKHYAEPLRQMELVIIDEISMLHRDVLKYLDTIFKDVCDNDDDLFAGKVILIGTRSTIVCDLEPRMLQVVTGNNCVRWSRTLGDNLHKQPRSTLALRALCFFGTSRSCA